MSRAELNYAARVDLALAFRACDFYDLGYGIYNHITQRAPARNGDGDVMLVCPYGLHFSEVTASRLIGVDFDTGEVLEGDGEIAATASAIHRAIHKARYPVDGITSVMHTHQPYTTALACLDDPEPIKFALHQTAMLFYNRVAYDWDYTGIALEEDEGERLAKILGDKAVLLMGNHGVLVVGKRACDAFSDLHGLECAAKNQILVQSTSLKMRMAPEKVVKEVATPDPRYGDYQKMFYDSLKRMLKDSKPCFMD
ncbi:putative aldolase class 2 protein CC_1201 [Diadema antillarum]|uniref:putative aldolase class 2 protein CC_1201 n=1 Tax=Diadema antillarum TaxID=105358 RepID=UPI003A88E1B7